MTEHFDALVIGSGQAGNPLARRLAQAGRRVALIERKRFGGTCVNVGCIPTKAWVASARAVHAVRSAGALGVAVGGPVSVEMARIKARKDDIVARGSAGVEESLRKTAGVAVLAGHARFTGLRTVQVGGRTLAADQVFLNVGARAAIPAIPGLAGTPHLTNTTILELDQVPRHLMILGGSYIGLEFGQMFRRFGSAVTVLEQGPRLVPREDADVSEAIRAILEAEGMRILTGMQVTAVAGGPGSVRVRGQTGTGPLEVEGSHLLVAVGRRPNTDDLDAAAAGIQLDRAGYVIVDDHLQSSAPGVWALGDCNGKGAFTHTSYNDFEIVAANLLEGESRKVSDRVASYALYIDPPLGRAGLTEAQVRASGVPALMGTYPMRGIARARLKNETQGFMKVLAEAGSGRILGAAVLGAEGDEVAASFLTPIYARTPYRVMQFSVPPHPTISEFIPVLLEDMKPLV
ncbi:MAG TPA: FAD-containing oxidoreductase [bacterium]|nr:FAD-containing oxidoreductase [bacterium]